MGEHSTAVDALPPERVVRHRVDLVPGDLLGEEPPRARRADDLGECCGVTEGIRQPDLLGLDPEVLEEESLAGDELAGQRLPAWHVGV